MDKRKLIQELIDQAQSLPHRDKQALEDLRSLGEVIIRNIYGENNTYLRDFSSICSGFVPTYVFGRRGSEAQYERDWRFGQERLLRLLSTMMEELGLAEKADSQVEQLPRVTSEGIFIVHGHDEEMKQAAARTLEMLGLEAIILHERADRGRTVIEKFTDHADVGFSVVLLSPDDVGYLKGDGPGKARPRARQNVILELGFFLGKLGRERVFVLVRDPDQLEWPSDYSGVLHTSYDSAGGWRNRLVRELRACGYDVDADKFIGS